MVEHVQKIRDQLGVRAGRPLILFASQPYYHGSFSSPGIRRDMIQGLFDAASKAAEVVLAVRPHPLEDAAELRSMARGRPNIVLTDRQVDVRQLIQAADAFVTFFSSTAFDALAMGKPTINLAYPGGCANDLFERCGATLVAKNDNEIAAILRSIETGEIAERVTSLSRGRETFLEGWFHRLDGRAAERIGGLALAMAAPPR
jgi:CDP-glycerol glycerophosphotransferase (TagB/SpsB family)